jgi:hypothetical protein
MPKGRKKKQAEEEVYHVGRFTLYSPKSAMIFMPMQR